MSASEVADAVVVRVLEGPGVDLVDDGSTPPRVLAEGRDEEGAQTGESQKFGAEHLQV